MRKLYRASEVGQQTTYTFDCPYCGNGNESDWDPIDYKTIKCDHCKKDIEVIDDL